MNDLSHTLNVDDGLFGLPHKLENAKIVILPIPWDATASYGKGASLGPQTIRNESIQLDLYDYHFKDAYKQGIHMIEMPQEIQLLNEETRQLSDKVISHLERGLELANHEDILKHINTNSLRLNQWVYAKTISLLESGKIVACLGGEHSIPYGAIKAYSERNSFSILHIDAHADLRVAYQGFEHSHASIMNQVMTLSKPPQKLVQVGIRDFCAEEYDYINEHKNIKTYFDYAIKQDLFSGKTWIELCEEIVDQLGENVYISFDIDGLLPELCPQTGTPVPGGLSFEQAVFLLKTLSDKGKKIIGFDLCEVAQRDSENYWDGVVGARVLYQLCGWCLKTQNGSK